MSIKMMMPNSRATDSLNNWLFFAILLRVVALLDLPVSALCFVCAVCVRLDEISQLSIQLTMNLMKRFATTPGIAPHFCRWTNCAFVLYFIMLLVPLDEFCGKKINKSSTRLCNSQVRFYSNPKVKNSLFGLGGSARLPDKRIRFIFSRDRFFGRSKVDIATHVYSKYFNSCLFKRIYILLQHVAFDILLDRFVFKRCWAIITLEWHNSDKLVVTRTC